MVEPYDVECANSSTCRSQLFLKPCFSSSTGPKKFDYKFSELLKKYFVKITIARLVVISPKGGKLGLDEHNMSILGTFRNGRALTITPKCFSRE